MGILLGIEAAIGILAVIVFVVGCIARLPWRWLQVTIVASFAWLPVLLALAIRGELRLKNLAIEALVIISIIVVGIIYGAVRLPWRWAQTLLIALLIGLPLVPVVALPFAEHLPIMPLRAMWEIFPTATRAGMVSLSTLLAGGVAIPCIGLWMVNGNVPLGARGQTWPLGKTLLLGVTSLTLLVMTCAVIDWSVCRRAAAAIETNEKVVAGFRKASVATEPNAAPKLSDIYRRVAGDGKLPTWIWLVSDPSFDVKQKPVQQFAQRHRSELAPIEEAARLPSASFAWVENYGIPSSDTVEFRAKWGAEHLMALAVLESASNHDIAGSQKYFSLMTRLIRMPTKPETSARAWGKGYSEVTRKYVLQRLLGDVPDFSSDIQFPIKITESDCLSFGARSVECEASAVANLYYRQNLGISVVDDEWFKDVPSAENEIDRFARRISLPIVRIFAVHDDLQSFPRYIAMVKEAGQNQRLGILAIERWQEATPSGYITTRNYVEQRLLLSRAAEGDLNAILADLALALTGFRQRYGKYPTKLVELVPEFVDRIPDNPVSGATIAISRCGDGAVLHVGGYYDPKPSDQLYEFDLVQMSIRNKFYLGEAYQRLKATIKPEEILDQAPGDEVIE